MNDAAPPTDPFEMMREAYDQAIENWATTMEQVVSTEEFASASGQFLKRYVELQESMRTAAQATAESLQIPTADDLARVAQLVVNVERKVDEVSDETHAIALAPQPTAKSLGVPTTDDLARVARSVSDIERVVGQVSDEAQAIAQRLASIEATLAELARRPPATPPSGSPAPTAPAVRQEAPAATPKPAAATPGKAPAAKAKAPATKAKAPAAPRTAARRRAQAPKES